MLGEKDLSRMAWVVRDDRKRRGFMGHDITEEDGEE